jgi:hypothetical protein
MAALYFTFAWPSINNASNSITVTGTLGPGVEAGCVILRADDGTEYLLLGWSNYPPAGARVTLTGYFDNSIASYCMQGKAAIHVVSISISNASASVSYGTGTATASGASVMSGSTQQSTTIGGVLVATSGYIYSAIETPQFYPQCGAPSFILAYLNVPPGTGCMTPMGCYPPPQYYRLLNIDGSPFWGNAPNGTYALSVAGILVAPSSWNCDSFYLPKICMSGDIYVQTLSYSERTRIVSSASSTMTINETSTNHMPMPGFELPSILVGLLLGLAVLVLTKHRLLDGQETPSR